MNWTETRLKHLAATPVVSGVGEAAAHDNPGWPRYVRTTDIEGPVSLRSDTFASLPPTIAEKAPLVRNDIVMTAAGATIGKASRYVSDEPACYAGYLVRFRARPGVDPRFIGYWMESAPYWDQIGRGKVVSTIENFSASKYQNLRLRIPSYSEQVTIANYLDEKTARIDAIIAKKRRMSYLLDARMPVWIQNALDGASRSVSHVRLKSIVRVIDERRGSRDLPLYSVSIHRGVVPRDQMTDDLPRAEDLSNYKCCRSGDLVLNRMRAFQGAVGVSPGEGIVSTDYIVMRPGPSCHPSYLHYLLRSPKFVSEMTARLRGIGSSEQGTVRTPRVNADDLLGIRVAVPTYEAQAGLARALDEKADVSRRLVVTLTEQVARLKEHRQALITAAITGELNVTGTAA